MAIRTLIVEDNAAMRHAIADLLREDPGLEVVGLAADTGEGISRARELRPDVALVDVRMPGGGGTRATREMMKLEPPPRVVAMSVSRDRDAVVEMLRSGAVGYLVKGGPADELRQAVRLAARGESSLSPGAAGELIDTVVEQMENTEMTTAEEQEIGERVRDLIDSGGPEIVFQPILDLSSGQTAGYEALSRFGAEPVRGPLQWFADARRLGLGLELELAAIRNAVSEARRAGGDLFEGRFLAVNVSPPILLSDRFTEVLRDEGLPLRLVIEVTEHAEIEDYEEFGRAFSALRGRGVRLAVDDVGAGYASLRHILRLSPDLIKLDISLTHDLATDRPKRALAAGLISFAREVGATVIAEGVETQQELDALVDLGAHCGQGYFLARPGQLGERPG